MLWYNWNWGIFECSWRPLVTTFTFSHPPIKKDNNCLILFHLTSRITRITNIWVFKPPNVCFAVCLLIAGQHHLFWFINIFFQNLTRKRWNIYIYFLNFGGFCFAIIISFTVLTIIKCYDQTATTDAHHIQPFQFHLIFMILQEYLAFLEFV